jgi:quercetin dioxygenase-like cupin family protein
LDRDARDEGRGEDEGMTLRVRRVVTGHDADGRAVVKFDDVVDGTPRRPGTSARVIWTTESFPVDNTVVEDQADREIGTTLPNGTVFRILELEPGAAPRRHRTDSVDYAVILSGEIDMEMDDTVVHLRAGDTLVQRGTIHNWVNNGSKPCVIAFILIDAKSVDIGGKVLPPEG